MTPQLQRSFREHGDEDDCWSTCVAMLVDEPTADVPNFVVDAIRSTGYPGDINAFPTEARTPWPRLTDEWLATKGLQLRRLDFEDERRPADTFQLMAGRNPDVRYAIVVGQSPRGNYGHAIVVDLDRVRAGLSDGALDPHPSDEGLADWWHAYAIEPRVAAS